MNDQDSSKPNHFLGRLRELAPSGLPSDDRGRMRMVVDSLVLHLHPSKVPERTLKWSYTWGLGGLSALLVVILAITGVFLQMNYTPSPPQAYLDILNLRTATWFGDLLRNLHHWSANLLIITSVLHLLRVFFTGAHRAPRELNWLLGVGMLLLVLASNFTGYLLPWDQLAFWAITVGTSILSYVPLVGPALSRLLLGGPEVGAATLLNFYSLHISFIPLFIAALMSYHFWRVRKDGGLTIPKSKSEVEGPVSGGAVSGGPNPVEPKMERVTTIPHLVRREATWAVAWLAILIAWSIAVPAPLEGIADPAASPNPAKAPWYFLGIQELLLHFHPFVGAVLLPALGVGTLALLPFFDIHPGNIGVYFRSRRGRWIATLSAGFGLLVTPLWVLLDEYILNWASWLPNWPTLVTTGLVPLAIAMLGLAGIDETLKGLFRASSEERVLSLFITLFTALVVLTAVGIYFRGPGMELFWPWAMPAAH